MYLGQQLTDISERRLALEAQLGVEQVAVNLAREEGVTHNDGRWSVDGLRRIKERCNKYDISLEVLALETDSLFRSMAMGLEGSEKLMHTVLANIAAAAEAGIPCLKYRFQPIGVLRTGRQPGRGGAKYSWFDFEKYDETKVHSSPHYLEGEMVIDPLQLRIPEQTAWEVLEQFLKTAIPVAEGAKIRLAMHPQDTPLPLDKELRVQHVLSSVESLQRFLDLYPSPCNGLNFCQGTVAEMCDDPATEVLEAIQHFGSQDKIFMVHFRNIQGGYLNFKEVYPDNGDVDMLEAMRVYKQIGYHGMFCPDHVPVSESDPDQERQFSFCVGYIRGLLHAVTSDARSHAVA